MVLSCMERVMEKLAIPMSSLDPLDISEFINSEKTTLADCEADYKDARRRINGAKGPKKRKPVEDEAGNGSGSDGSCSD